MKHSYLGITLHCIDKNLALVRVFLGLKELHGSHTAVLLRSQAEELLNKYKLNDILLVESLSAEDDEEDEPESAITARGEMDILEEEDGSESSEELLIQLDFKVFITQEELEQRQSRAGIQAGAKSWIGDILRRGITAKASAISSIDPLVYWQKLIDTVIFCHSITSLDEFALGVQVTGDYGSRDFNSSRNECTIERVFSSAGLATRGQRNKTEFEVLDAQLVVNCNSWMQHM
uniref:Uncharacterized protein n=1 Tax=Ditylenchus dipsaci TaxID=166011 RepID=A0A915EQI4_9BILA